MELFREDGCLSDEGLHALTAGQLDELGRLEAAEHLAYCDKCTDRYTALLTADALADPPRDVRRTVMSTIWVRLMQSTCGRAAVAGIAAVREQQMIFHFSLLPHAVQPVSGSLFVVTASVHRRPLLRDSTHSGSGDRSITTLSAQSKPR